MPTAKVTITRIHHLSPQIWMVHVACGHHFTVTAPDLERQQLFIGKRVTCATCQQLHAKGKMKT
jgi:hypothetical protein